MYLLYLDESGNENDPNDDYFVLAGLALFERQTFFLAKAFEEVQEKYFPKHQPIPFHASAMRAGKDIWRRVSHEVRLKILADLCAEIVKSPAQGRTLYAAAIKKTSQLWGEQAVEKATEQVCKRFDIFLQRQFQDHHNAQRGLIVFSEGRFDARAKIWVKNFHQHGTEWGAITNLADIPYFASMRESRLLQAADIIAHAVWLMYEHHDLTLIKPFLTCFDTQGGVLHGLVHMQEDPVCDCPACFSRKKHGSLGPWVDA